jgi:hypothetical protein
MVAAREKIAQPPNLVALGAPGTLKATFAIHLKGWELVRSE